MTHRLGPCLALVPRVLLLIFLIALFSSVVVVSVSAFPSVIVVLFIVRRGHTVGGSIS
jgi:hypothetical protein